MYISLLILLAEDLIDGELDARDCDRIREHEDETGNSELRLISDFKTEFDWLLQ